MRLCSTSTSEREKASARERERARARARAQASESERASKRASAKKNVLIVCRYVCRPASSHIALLLHLSNSELGSLQFLLQRPLLFRRLCHDLCVVCVFCVCAACFCERACLECLECLECQRVNALMCYYTQIHTHKYINTHLYTCV